MRSICDSWLEELEALARGRVSGKIEERPAKIGGKPTTVWVRDFGRGSIVLGSTREAADWALAHSLECMKRRVGEIPWC